MAILTPSALKAIFRNGYTPTEADFADVFDSFLSKLESLPASKVSGLSALIDAAVAARTGADGTDLTIVVGAGGITVQSSTGTDVVLPIANSSDPGLFSSSLFDKLNGIEAGATADQTGDEIVALLAALTGDARLSANNLRDLQAVIDARIATTGGGAVSGVVQTISGNGTYTVPANRLAKDFVIVPAVAGKIDIGTTPGGTELFTDDAGDTSPIYADTIFFQPTTGTLYFSGSFTVRFTLTTYA